jgi:hypothetical protein
MIFRNFGKWCIRTCSCVRSEINIINIEILHASEPNFIRWKNRGKTYRYFPYSRPSKSQEWQKRLKIRSSDYSPCYSLLSNFYSGLGFRLDVSCTAYVCHTSPFYRKLQAGRPISAKQLNTGNWLTRHVSSKGRVLYGMCRNRILHHHFWNISLHSSSNHSLSPSNAHRNSLRYALRVSYF